MWVIARSMILRLSNSRNIIIRTFVVAIECSCFIQIQSWERTGCSLSKIRREFSYFYNSVWSHPNVINVAKHKKEGDEARIFLWHWRSNSGILMSRIPMACTQAQTLQEAGIVFVLPLSTRYTHVIISNVIITCLYMHVCLIISAWGLKSLYICL